MTSLLMLSPSSSSSSSTVGSILGRRPREEDDQEQEWEGSDAKRARNDQIERVNILALLEGISSEPDETTWSE